MLGATDGWSIFAISTEPQRLLADKLDFENGRPKPVYKHRLLAMIDEFPALGNWKSFRKV
jgi:hypothetical protein